MKDLIDKYKREPIVIAVVVGIIIYVLYLLISPYQKCMSLAPENKYVNNPDSDYHGQLTYDWKKHKRYCVSKHTF